MPLLIPGSSGFIGTNFKKDSRFQHFRDADLLTVTPEQINFAGIDTVLHLSALVHQMKGAPEKEYFKVNSNFNLRIR